MKEKMNVIFIITDAQRADHLGCAGNPYVKTPNIDALAKESVRFSNYYCTNPICMPNRATLLTGLYPNVHRVRSNGMKLDENIPTITKVLRKKGWHTAAVGKLHHQFWIGAFKHRTKSSESLTSWAVDKGKKDPVGSKFPLPYYGYDEVELVSGNGSVCAGHYTEWLEERAPKIAIEMNKRVQNYDNIFSLYCDAIPGEFYNTTYVQERTISFLERHARGDYGDKPFYLHCSFPDPHYPLFPPLQYQGMYKPEDIELPASFHDIKNLYNHQYLGNHLKNPPFKKAFIRESSEDEVRNITALTYAAITYVDYSVGQILATLNKLGYAENTMVIFTSDHGDLMGDHGLLFKGPCPFNGVLNIPLIWKVPGFTKPGVSNSLVSTIDLPKTMLNLLEIKERNHPPRMQGFDISQVLENSDRTIRDCILVENDEEVGMRNKSVFFEARIRHLITDDYKLTVYEGSENFGDIYDRKQDPLELNNLWNDTNFRDMRFELVNKLLHENLKAQTKIPGRIAGS